MYQIRSFMMFVLVGMVLSLYISAEAQVISETENELYTTAWSPDGRMIAGAGYNLLDSDTLQPYMKVWDVQTGQIMMDLQPFENGHNGGIVSLSWSPDSTKIASAEFGGLVVIWNISDPNYELGEIIAVMSFDDQTVRFVEWHEDGTRILTSGNPVHIWETETFTQIASFADSYSVDNFGNAAWQPNGTLIAISAQTGAYLYDDTLSTPSGPNANGAIGPNDEPDLASATLYVAWHPSGDLLAVSYFDGHIIRIIDIETDEVVQNIDGHGFASRTLAWNPDGRRLAGGGDGFIIVWDTETGDVIATYEPEKSYAQTGLGWSPDGTQLSFPHILDEDETLVIVTPPNVAEED